MTFGRRSLAILLGLTLGTGLAEGQEPSLSVRLPLPVDGPAQALFFEVAVPTAGVLTGLLLPSSGPLTAWAPVFSTLAADGGLKEGPSGAWTGPLPPKWLRIVRPGSVVAGFRLLVRTKPQPVQIRQVQVFWRPWSGGGVSGPVTESQVYGLRAGPGDEVRIIELRVPDGAVPTSIYGQTLGKDVAQVSLVVRQRPLPPATEPAEGQGPRFLGGPVGPTGPTVSAPALK